MDSLSVRSSDSLSPFPHHVEDKRCIPSWLLLFCTFINGTDVRQRQQIFGKVEPLAVVPPASHLRAVKWGHRVAKGWRKTSPSAE